MAPPFLEIGKINMRIRVHYAVEVVDKKSREYLEKANPDKVWINPFTMKDTKKMPRKEIYNFVYNMLAKESVASVNAFFEKAGYGSPVELYNFREQKIERPAPWPTPKHRYFDENLVEIFK